VPRCWATHEQASLLPSLPTRGLEDPSPLALHPSLHPPPSLNHLGPIVEESEEDRGRCRPDRVISASWASPFGGAGPPALDDATPRPVASAAVTFTSIGSPSNLSVRPDPNVVMLLLVSTLLFFGASLLYTASPLSLSCPLSPLHPWNIPAGRQRDRGSSPFSTRWNPAPRTSACAETGRCSTSRIIEGMKGVMVPVRVEMGCSAGFFRPRPLILICPRGPQPHAISDGTNSYLSLHARADAVGHRDQAQQRNAVARGIIRRQKGGRKGRATGRPRDVTRGRRLGIQPCQAADRPAWGRDGG
jgi:hypothetical protein